MRLVPHHITAHYLQAMVKMSTKHLRGTLALMALGSDALSPKASSSILRRRLSAAASTRRHVSKIGQSSFTRLGASREDVYEQPYAEDASALMERLRAGEGLGGFVVKDMEDDFGDDGESNVNELTARAWAEAELCREPEPLVPWTERETVTPSGSSKASASTGKGFGINMKSPRSSSDQGHSRIAGVVKGDGVARVDQVLSKKSAQRLRALVLAELDKEIGEDDGRNTGHFSDVLSPTNSRARIPATTRWDFRLPLTSTVAESVEELLGGELGKAFDELCGGSDAELWELAAIVSAPGSAPQTVHSDTVFDARPCLFTSFVALQDIGADSGPTRFFPCSHNANSHSAFDDSAETFLPGVPCVDAQLPQGSCSLYDGRLLHCGRANTSPDGGNDRENWRVLFYVTFRHTQNTAVDEVANEAAHSIRPELLGRLTLANCCGSEPWPDDLFRAGDGGNGGDGGGGGGSPQIGPRSGRSGSGATSGGGGSSPVGSGGENGDSEGASFKVPDWFNYEKSTEENYCAFDTPPFSVGEYAGIRATLDFTYHKRWPDERQLFQDSIVKHFLHNRDNLSESREWSWWAGEWQAEWNDDSTVSVTQESNIFGLWSNFRGLWRDSVISTDHVAPRTPQLVMTAGAMGAGKSHAMRLITERGLFPRRGVVHVDTDLIRAMLPEAAGYSMRDKTLVGANTQKEAGLIQEILVRAIPD